MADQLATFAMIVGKRYPAALGKVVPLARGVRERLYDEFPKVPRPVINAYLQRRCRSPEYLAACADPGAARVNLDGTVVEPVSDTHRKFSEELLSRRRAS